MSQANTDLTNSAVVEMNMLMGKLIPLVGSTGVYVTELESGLATAELPPEVNGNHIGTIYAGSLFVLAEVLGGIICWETFDRNIYYPIVKDLHIKFSTPARGKIKATARLGSHEIQEINSQVASRGKADFALNVDLIDANGTVVAVSNGVYQLRKLPFK
ncbi:MAG: YiiD C-terminal domain-containing protein [Mycobacteriaceae bacterium]